MGRPGTYELRLKSGQSFDYETAKTVSVTVEVNDQATGSNITTQPVTITVSDVVENTAPTARADTIYVSDASDVVLPWSMFLSNDTDPEGALLAIQSVTVLNGVAGGPIDVSINTTDRRFPSRRLTLLAAMTFWATPSPIRCRMEMAAALSALSRST